MTIEECLKANVLNQNVCFVFPTDVASKKWADWTIKNTECQAIAMERFLAWDTFKGECIKSEVEDLETIPSLMRKLFAAKLLKENSHSPFLKFIIPEEYSDNASAFTDSISKLLPSLQMWNLLHQNQNLELAFDDTDDDKALKVFYDSYKSQNFTDLEDADYEAIFQRYSAFLKENHLFDPAWIIPDFSETQKEYFLIYPEILEDWEQYKYKLAKINSIKFVHVPEAEKKYTSYFYDNSRTELKEVSLYLREKHESGIKWSEMAVSVPNLDNYGSYINREFELYEIPHSIRYSRPLNTYGAGAVFSQIQECYANDFSYESIRDLLLNEDIPWKQKFTINNLLLFGKLNNCLCNWEEAFKNPLIDPSGLYNDQLLREFYRNLTQDISRLVKAKTFKELNKAYNIFRDTYFELEGFELLDLSNKVLSRCVSLLSELIDLENKFGDFELPSPFSFFTNQLGNVQYLSQGSTNSVQVYPYRTAAAAPYSVHVVIDATQDSLSVSSLFKPMNFMNENKKKLFIKIGAINQDLAFNDADPSYDFIKLYQHSSTCETLFTGATHAFNGAYGFSHGKLLDTITKSINETKVDVYKFVDALDNSTLPKFYKTQKTGFDTWKQIQDNNNFDINNKDKLKEKIEHKLLVNSQTVEKNPNLKGKLQVSTSALNTFYVCPRLWLYKNILKIQPLNNEAEFIDTFIEGTVNHKIFELYFSALKDSDEALHTDNENPERLSDDKRKLLKHIINLAIEAKTDSNLKENPSAFYSFGKKSCSATTIKVIQALYALDETKNDLNPKFLLLEKSIAALCNKWRGYKVYDMEKEVYAFPPGEDGTPDENADYIFGGRIDCILVGPNKSAFTIVDFKTGMMPTNLYVEATEKGKVEKIIDFQMPMYIWLLENNLKEDERIKITNAHFYSIKYQTISRFCGQGGVEDDADDKISQANEKAKIAMVEFQTRAKTYVQKITDLDFSVTLKHQYPAKCSAKGNYGECVDYQAVCRRFYTVDGEQL